MRKCDICKRKIPDNCFHKNRYKPDGLSTSCKECKKRLDKSYRERNRGKIKELKHEYYVSNSGNIKNRVFGWIKENRDKVRGYSKTSRIKIKTEVFSHYENGEVKCHDCGETEIEILSIDHVDGGGNKHREETGAKGGANFYRWLKNNNYPSGFQVLCFNCQYKKRLIELRSVNPSKTQLLKREYARSVKSQCLEHYGKICKCGETDVDLLTLDHVNDDGAIHRKETNTRGLNFYIYLRKNEFPMEPPLQVLCMNCQMRKRSGLDFKQGRR